MTSNSAPIAKFSLSFEQKPCMRVITSARNFIEALFVPLVGSDSASRVSMVAHELLENISKYASAGTAGLVVTATSRADANLLVRVSTYNQAPAQLLNELEAILNDISSASDPRTLYLRYMEASVRRGHGSKLGMIRIRAEGEMSLRFERSDGSITIQAETVAARVDTPLASSPPTNT